MESGELLIATFDWRIVVVWKIISLWNFRLYQIEVSKLMCSSISILRFGSVYFAFRNTSVEKRTFSADLLNI